MNFDTTANLQDRDCVGTAIHIDNEPMLIERLQAFGLIESNGKGGWQLTQCCEAGLATCARNTDTPPQTAAAVIRPWRPRTLVQSDIR